MPNFRYRARDKNGEAVTGMMEGPSREMVANRLGELGLIPVQFREEKPKSYGSAVKFFQKMEKVRAADMVLFNRQLATLIHAGIPITASLTTLSEQTRSKKLSRVLKDVVRWVEGGSSLSDALSRYPEVFSALYVNIVKAGEAGGVLDEVLERLASLTEKEAETRAKMKAAMRYPKIVIVAICVAFSIVMGFVIPRFAGMFRAAKAPLPLPTRILLAVNDFLHQYWYLGLVVIAGLVIGFKLVVRTEKGKALWDSFKLKVPIFGSLVSKIILSRFARMVGVLNRSGVPILTNLGLVAELLNNAVFSRVVIDLRKGVEQGKSLAEPMRSSAIFTPMIVHMVTVGEESGSLDEMLFKVSDYYDAEVDDTLKNLSTLIEPLLIVLIGGMVLALALGVFLPMWDMATVVTRR
ncbi:MAG: type II secretion system F family protein [Deltaproteobacteria bacterium]|nr:MAG: type II secretion system F family protein [Deltaproteobacteria bacterium]